MLRTSLVVLALAGALSSWPALAAESDLAALKAEIAQMRAAYEQRIAALEGRLQNAEQAARQQQAARPHPEAPSAPGGSSGGGRLSELASGFNPQLSVILDGGYYRDSRKGRGPEMLENIDGISHAHDHEGHSHGALEPGFYLREAELVFSASVSPYFDANLKMTVAPGGGVELEEAYFDTRALPAGLKLRGGKFFSGIGYQNSQHPHQWDFVDQNLAYLSLLGDHGLNDTGLRVEWVPKTGNWYTLLGVELLQGKEHKFATAGEEVLGERADGNPLAGTFAGALSAKKAGPRLTTAYAKFAPDLGDRHALQFGVFGAWARQHQEVHDHTAEDAGAFVHGLEGKGRLWGTDWVYKYDAGREGGWGNLKLAAEYLRQTKDLTVAFHELGNLVGQKREMTQDGFYVQASYGFAPHWQAGVRYDVTGLTNEIRGPAGLIREMDPSRRWTLALTRDITEFSRFRLQFSKARLSVEGARENLNEVYLQYVHSLGAHGAHSF